MEGEQRQSTYENLNRNSINKDNVYELCQISAATKERRVEETRVELPENMKNIELKWNKPIIILIIVLLSLMVMLLAAIFGLMLFTRDTTSTAGANTGANTGATTGATTGDNTGSLGEGSTALPTSCEQLKIQHPTTGSGYYILASTNGSTTYSTYCNMRLLCGSIGWTRLAYLDLYGGTCPSGFRLYQSGSYRACGRPVTSSGSCVSVQFPSNGISYSQICGRVYGYQYGSTDAIGNLSSSYRIDINSHYVDGVSITRGSPRQHVWTLMAGYSETSAASNACPCNNGSSVSVQSFIGNNYFCESGNPNSSPSQTLYSSDPLWDGQGCGSLESPCCNVPGIPWFHRDYGNTTTTDYIELRVCASLSSSNEDSPVSYYEIYVK